MKENKIKLRMELIIGSSMMLGGATLTYFTLFFLFILKAGWVFPFVYGTILLIFGVLLKNKLRKIESRN